MKVAIIAALSDNRVIGVNGTLPWVLSADIQHFRRLTMGHPVIMGRLTYESIPPQFRPLADRTNIVLTSQSNYLAPGCVVVSTLLDGLKAAAQPDVTGSNQVFILGGAQVYKEALVVADEMHLTVVDATIPDGTAFFPDFDPGEWLIEPVGSSFTAGNGNDFSGSFYHYRRTGASRTLVEPRNARNIGYELDLRGILLSGQCPYCPGGFTFRQQPMIHENSSWYVTHNAHPLANTSCHVVIFPARHVRFFQELNAGELEDFQRIIRWVEQHFGFTGCAFFARQGEMLVTGATVGHLHFQLLVPEKEVVKVFFGPFSTT